MQVPQLDHDPLQRSHAVSLAGDVKQTPLAGTCDTSTARPVPTDETGTQRFDDAVQSNQATGPRRFYRFPGGCVTYQFSPSTRGDPKLAALADAALGFVPREQVAAYVREHADLPLCGAGASCPGG